LLISEAILLCHRDFLSRVSLT